MAAPTAYRQTNPFTPMFGRVPAYMAGREQIIDDMVLAFENDDSDPNLCSVFYGARGTGKTALLAYLSYRAPARGLDYSECDGLGGDARRHFCSASTNQPPI